MDLKQLEYFSDMIESADSAGRARCSGSRDRRSAGRYGASRSNCARTCCCGTGAARRRPNRASACLRTRAASFSRSTGRAREVEEKKGAPGRTCRRRPAADGGRLRDAAGRAGISAALSPGLAVDLEGLSRTIHEWLLVGRVDVGLIYNPVHRPRSTARPLLDEAALPHRPAEARILVPHAQAGRTSPVSLIISSRPHAIRMLVETRSRPSACAPRRNGNRRGPGDPRADRRRARPRGTSPRALVSAEPRSAPVGARRSCSPPPEPGSPLVTSPQRPRRRSSSGRSS